MRAASCARRRARWRRLICPEQRRQTRHRGARLRRPRPPTTTTTRRPRRRPEMRSFRKPSPRPMLARSRCARRNSSRAVSQGDAADAAPPPPTTAATTPTAATSSTTPAAVPTTPTAAEPRRELRSSGLGALKTLREWDLRARPGQPCPSDLRVFVYEYPGVSEMAWSARPRRVSRNARRRGLYASPRPTRGLGGRRRGRGVAATSEEPRCRVELRRRRDLGRAASRPQRRRRGCGVVASRPPRGRVAAASPRPRQSPARGRGVAPRRPQVRAHRTKARRVRGR